MWKADRLIPLAARRWLYGIATAALPLLIAYGVIGDDRASLWTALIGAILVPSVALTATVPDNNRAVIPPTVVDDITTKDEDSETSAVFPTGPRHAEIVPR